MLDSGSQRGSRSGRGDADDPTLVRYWGVIRERFWLIVLCTVLGLVAAGAYVAVAHRTYQAQAELEIQAASPNDTTLASLPVLHQSGDPVQDVLTGASLVTLQPVAAAVVQSLHSHMTDSEALSHISATPIGQAGFVAVQATASSPKLAQQLANGFMTQTIRLGTDRMHAAIEESLPTLRNQLASVPVAARYGPGSLGEQVDELQQLLQQNDPTLVSVAAAQQPEAPSSPKKKLSLIAGLIGGLLIGTAAAFMFHTFDPRLRREDQVREELELPILARISRQRRVPPRPMLPHELSPQASEGYRTLRTTMATRGLHSGSRAFLVTGTAPAEGKSTTALGLALGLAQAGGSVIMIEAELRKPTFSKSFALGEFAGIQQVLTGELELDEAIVPAVIDETDIGVLAAHPSSGDVPGIISTEIVRKLVDDAKRLADFVVIDSAPLTAVIDALPFAQMADEVVVVARLGLTRIKKLAQLDELLLQSGVTRVGVVLIGDLPADGSEYYLTGGRPVRRGSQELEVDLRASGKRSSRGSLRG